MPTLSETVASRKAVRPERALVGRDIVCFSHDWDWHILSRNHLMRLLARDNRVLWVNSIGYRTPTASKADATRLLKKMAMLTRPILHPEPNIFTLSPLAIPAYTGSRVRAFNKHLLGWQVRRAMRRLGFRHVINWVFNPAAAVIAGALGEDRLIYHCVDDYASFSGVPARALAEMEDQLLRRADLVIASSTSLYESKVRKNSRTVLVRHGVTYEHFRRALDRDTVIPEEVARLPRPILGFCGHVAADWVDFNLLRHVAESFPGGSVVLVGQIDADVSDLRKLPNVHFIGRKLYETVPAYCKGFDVALIPFRISDLTLSCNPLKSREYLAAGLPVVSTPIPEVEALGLCRIAPDAPAFVRQIEAALAEPGPLRSRSEAMSDQGWETRLAEIDIHLQKSLPRQ
jgi:glycosyltransferase involved in cell wall biosynthesis